MDKSTLETDNYDIVQEVNRKVSGYFHRALIDVSTELGGEDYANQINDIADIDNNDGWVSVESLEKIAADFPEHQQLLLERFSQIGKEDRLRELKESKKLKNLIKNMLRGVASINISGK